MQEDNSQKSIFWPFFAGALIGSAAGTIAGLLLAPKSGPEIRNQLSENVTDTQGKALQFLGTAKSSIFNGVDSASKNIETTVHRVVDAFNAGSKAAKGTIAEENIAKLEKNNISDKMIDVNSDNMKNIDSSDKANEKSNFSEHKEVKNEIADNNI